MNEYEITLSRGWFDKKKIYMTANSAQEVKERLEDELGYEMEFEGLSIQEIKKL